MKLPPLVRALRPEQWSKNALVAAAYIFALGDRTQTLPASAPLHTLIAFLCFCFVSSAVYLFNDLQDIERDRLHPRKRFRPLAAGEITAVQTRLTALLLIAIALPLAGMVAPSLLAVLAGYLFLQVAYTLRLKHIPYLDVTALSAGFVLRTLAGAVAIPVPASPWILLCTFSLALYLALCKRRHEKNAMKTYDGPTRPSLNNVSETSLEFFLTLSLILSVLTYAAYSISPDVVAKHDGRHLLWTLPFVIFGLLRYRHRVLHEDQGDRPELQLITDPLMLINSVLYLAVLLWTLRP
jgi:4-hydroxybenzoate polyprenyltransferase